MAQLAPKIGDVHLGGEIGTLGPFLYRRDEGLGLRLGEAGLTQSFRDLQGIDRHLKQAEPGPVIGSRS